MSTAKPEFSPQALAAALTTLMPHDASGELCVAFSGGLDSTVLLTGLSMALAAHPRWSLRAIHLDHQLQPDSAQWQLHCAKVAANCGIPCSSQRLDVVLAGEGLEAAARNARYAALRAQLRRGEVLLTAHHADDQLETMLLGLARGAGVRGLAAMPDIVMFAEGWHMRPLLSFTREQLHTWAVAQHLNWLEDPSNAQSAFSRNYLRNELMPGLAARWPAVALNARRSAQHLSAAEVLLDDLAAIDLQQAAVESCLRVAVLRELSVERRRNLLRFWLRQHGLRAPSTRKLHALEHDMLEAQSDRNPCTQWDDVCVRRHRGLLYAIAEAQVQPIMAYEWHWRDHALSLGVRMGSLQAIASSGRGIATRHLPAMLQVSTRSDGQRFHVSGRAQERTLKDLLRESNVLPWWRDRLPLIRIDRRTIAIADLMVAEEFAAQPDEAAIELIWSDRPRIHCVTQ